MYISAPHAINHLFRPSWVHTLFTIGHKGPFLHSAHSACSLVDRAFSSHNHRHPPSPDHHPISQSKRRYQDEREMEENISEIPLAALPVRKENYTTFYLLLLLLLPGVALSLILCTIDLVAECAPTEPSRDNGIVLFPSVFFFGNGQMMIAQDTSSSRRQSVCGGNYRARQIGSPSILNTPTTCCQQLSHHLNP